MVHEGYIPVQRGYMFSTQHVDTALLPCRTGCVKKDNSMSSDIFTTSLSRREQTWSTCSDLSGEDCLDLRTVIG